MEAHKNADRFTGFADVYEGARPKMPEYPIKVICEYLEKTPGLVVDLGCGTGLSTVPWGAVAEQVVGIEPSEDMFRVAMQKAGKNISFVKAYSTGTTLPDACADVVICSQSFHWMEPVSTLKEVDRVLKPGGIFATVDCDWPPKTKWQAEKAYMDLYNEAKQIEASNPAIKDSFVRYDKAKHLSNMEKSGYFRYCREVLFANTEPCTVQRFINILLSQGSLQAILKVDPQRIAEDIKRYEDTVRDIFGDEEFYIDFFYRMRVGVK